MGNFIVFILVLFILAAVLRIDFFFTLLYLFIGIYLLSHFWLRRVMSKLAVTRLIPERAFWGDRITVTLKLKNQSWLPIPWLMLHEVFPLVLSSPSFYTRVVNMGGKTDYSTRYTLTARKRGYYQIGPLTLHTGDLLGLKKSLTAGLPADQLIIYPRIVSMAQLVLPTHSPQVTLPTPIPLFQDPARPIGVRDYIPGDNPRSIHWTATATTGCLLVKQFQPAIARDNAIFLNLSRPDYAAYGYPDSVIELAITVAASLANHMIVIENLPVGLFTTTALDPLSGEAQSFKIPPRKGREHLMQILEVLARVQVLPDETDFLDTIRRQAVHLSWGTTIVIITSRHSAELAKLLLFLKRSGFKVTLVLINPPAAYRAVKEDPLTDVEFPVFKIRREEDIEVWSTAL